MDNRQVGLELEEEEQKINDKEKKDEKLNQKNKLKEESKVKKKEKKSVKEKEDDEEKETKKGRKKKKKENKENLCDEKSVNKICEPNINIIHIQPKSKFLNKKRKERVKEREKERERQIEKEEQKFGKNLLALQKELEDQDSENSENEADLINIKPLSVYVEEKKKNWNENKSSKDFSIEKLAKSMPIIPELNYQFLNTIINNDIDKFFDYYKFFQFTFSASQRKEFQNKIKDKCNLPIIINNFIPDTITDIKEILINLCNSIVKVECYKLNFLENLKKAFISNHVYSEKKFASSIPVRYGNRELKINKLIFEIVDFFYDKYSMNVEFNDENEKKLIRDKCSMFQLFQPIFENIELYDNDEELISVLNYLFNSIYVYFHSEEQNRDYHLFKNIILCCMPFKLKKAKTFFNEIKNNVRDDRVFVDDVDLQIYDIDKINTESRVHFKEKELYVNCKDINCYIDPRDFIQYLKGNQFMICFRYPKLTKINYLYINDKIRISYNELFKKIMKSETMKQAMNIDKEAKQFKYPFDDDSILNEVENNCYLVPLPATNYFGISDRVDYSIYLNSFISTSSYDKIFIDIDCITKSKCHEIKHIYRIYMHIYNPKIELKTPEIKYKKLENNELTKYRYNFFKTKEEIISEIYSSKNLLNIEVDELDYGDVLEFAINGKKQSVYFFLNSLFCLSEKSWEMKKGDFMINYFKKCFKQKYRLQLML
jgi:hypothetical protein